MSNPGKQLSCQRLSRRSDPVACAGGGACVPGGPGGFRAGRDEEAKAVGVPVEVGDHVLPRPEQFPVRPGAMFAQANPTDRAFRQRRTAIAGFHDPLQAQFGHQGMPRRLPLDARHTRDGDQFGRFGHRALLVGRRSRQRGDALEGGSRRLRPDGVPPHGFIGLRFCIPGEMGRDDFARRIGAAIGPFAERRRVSRPQANDGAPAQPAQQAGPVVLDDLHEAKARLHSDAAPGQRNDARFPREVAPCEQPCPVQRRGDHDALPDGVSD